MKYNNTWKYNPIQLFCYEVHFNDADNVQFTLFLPPNKEIRRTKNKKPLNYNLNNWSEFIHLSECKQKLNLSRGGENIWQSCCTKNITTSPNQFIPAQHWTSVKDKKNKIQHNEKAEKHLLQHDPEQWERRPARRTELITIKCLSPTHKITSFTSIQCASCSRGLTWDQLTTIVPSFQLQHHLQDTHIHQLLIQH